MRHGGMKDRILSASAPGVWFHDRKSVEDEIYTEVEFKLSAIESGLVGIVKQLLQPFFELFDFYRAPDERYEKIVNGFVNDTKASEQTR
jgi:hypothetical protein